MNCPACEGTAIHMRTRSTLSGFCRTIINPRKHSCPTCKGTGKMLTAPPTTNDRKAAAAAEGR